jgi:hypothetical protein
LVNFQITIDDSVNNIYRQSAVGGYNIDGNLVSSKIFINDVNHFCIEIFMLSTGVVDTGGQP